MTEQRSYLYPFTAIVGQDKMKQALLLNVINPMLGGIVIRGEKGTAKSTAVRALANVPDDLRVVNLPVSATEDRVVGTLDIEHAIQYGEKKFEPGLLAEADGHILYVDEINLLEDHIVDTLLDAAAMGTNTVEREGISFSHPARFIMVGTMNPEEGELRPQLLDRFALAVDVVSEKDVQQRTEVIRRRLAFEADPKGFCQLYAAEEYELVKRIEQAKEAIADVEFTEEMLSLAARVSIRLEIESHRADIMMMKTAMTIAAFSGRLRVIANDMKQAAFLVLPHRLRQAPFEPGGRNEVQIEQAFAEVSEVNA